MANPSGSSNVLFGDDLGGNTQGISELESTTSLDNIGGSSSLGHDLGCITPQCLSLDDMNEGEQWHQGFEEIDSYYPDPSHGGSQGNDHLPTETASGTATTIHGHIQINSANPTVNVLKWMSEATNSLETKPSDTQTRGNPQYLTAENHIQGGTLTGNGIDLNHRNNEEPNSFNLDEFIHENAYASPDSASNGFGKTRGRIENRVIIDGKPPSLDQEDPSDNGSSVEQHTPTHDGTSIQFGEATLPARGAADASSNLQDPGHMTSVAVQASPTLQDPAFTPRATSGPNLLGFSHHPTLGSANYIVAGSGGVDFSKQGFPSRGTFGNLQTTTFHQPGAQDTSIMPAYHLTTYSAFVPQQMPSNNQMSLPSRVNATSTEDISRNYQTIGMHLWDSPHPQFDNSSLGIHISMMGGLSSQVNATSTEDIGQNNQRADMQPQYPPHPLFEDSSLETHSSMAGGILMPTSSTLHPTDGHGGFPMPTEDNNESIHESQEHEPTAAQGTTGALTTVNDATYTNLFSDWNAVVAYYENERDPRPDYDTDSTVPQTALEHHIYVKQIVQAIRDITNTRDFPAESAARGLKPPQAYLNFQNNKYSDTEIQVLAWKILVRCKDKQQNGYLVSKQQRSRKPVVHESFQGLVNEICTALREQKSICKRLLDAEFFNEFIDNPVAQLKRAAQNKRLNENKATQIKKGRELLGDTTDGRKRKPKLAEGGKREDGELELGSNAQEIEGEAAPELPPCGTTSAHQERQRIDPAILAPRATLASQPVQEFGPGEAWGSVPMGGQMAESSGARPQNGGRKRGRGASGPSEEEGPRGGKRRRP